MSSYNAIVIRSSAVLRALHDIYKMFNSSDKVECYTLLCTDMNG